jgi:hypothetical protein
MHMRVNRPISASFCGDRDLPRMTTLGPSADPCRVLAPSLRPGCSRVSRFSCAQVA